MFLLFGTGSKQKERGLFSGMPCLFCTGGSTMMLTKQYNYFHLFFIPLIRYDVVYYLTCPECAAVYILEKRKAEQLCHNHATPVGSADMTMVRQGLHRCPDCGSFMQRESVFCPQCGNKL